MPLPLSLTYSDAPVVDGDAGRWGGMPLLLSLLSSSSSMALPLSFTPSVALVVDVDEKASIRSNFGSSLSFHPTANYCSSLVVQHGQTDSERHQPPTDRCVV